MLPHEQRPDRDMRLYVQWAHQMERGYYNSKMQRAVKTWLEGAKTLMDVMPNGTFICQYDKKQDLYDQFMLEAVDSKSARKLTS